MLLFICTSCCFVLYSKDLTAANASMAAKDAEAEEKNTTILQVCM